VREVLEILARDWHRPQLDYQQNPQACADGPRWKVTLDGQIALEHAARLIGESAATRARPARTEARAIEIRNPPLVVALGARTLTLDGRACEGTLSARLFDFGVCSVQLRIGASSDITWDEFTSFGGAVSGSRGSVHEPQKCLCGY